MPQWRPYPIADRRQILPKLGKHAPSAPRADTLTRANVLNTLAVVQMLPDPGGRPTTGVNTALPGDRSCTVFIAAVRVSY